MNNPTVTMKEVKEGRVVYFSGGRSRPGTKPRKGTFVAYPTREEALAARDASNKFGWLATIAG